MRGNGLRAILQDIQSALTAGGGAAQAKALEKLSQSFETQDAASVSDIASSVEATITEASLPSWQKHARALKAAGLDEREFSRAFAAIANDKSLKKSDLAEIAKEYEVRVGPKLTSEKIADKIRGAFYEKLYERDANAMAKRATPW